MQMEIRGTYAKDDLKVLVALSLRPTQRLYYPALTVAPFGAVFLFWVQGEPFLETLFVIVAVEAFLMFVVLWLGRVDKSWEVCVDPVTASAP